MKNYTDSFHRKKGGDKSMSKDKVKKLKTALFAVFIAGYVFTLAFGVKCIVDAYNAHSEGIDTPTINITIGERHICTVTDKTAEVSYTYKTVRVKKGAGGNGFTDTDTIYITSVGRYLIVYDKVGGIQYRVKV